MNMTESANTFEDGIIPCLPAFVLIVGAQLHHAEWHPGTRCDHPARMCASDPRVHVLRSGDLTVQRIGNKRGGEKKISLVTGRFSELCKEVHG